MDATKKQLEIMAAYEAGQSTPSVITAYQLRERLVNMLVEYDAETAMVSEQSKTLEYGDHVSIMVCAGRNQLIKKHRDALGIINEFIEIMESERAAEVSR